MRLLDVFKCEEGERSRPCLLFSDGEKALKEEEFRPYLLAEGPLEELSAIRFFHKGKEIRVVDAKPFSGRWFDGQLELVKLYVEKQSHLDKLKEYIKLRFGYRVFEFDIGVDKKYIIDNAVVPSSCKGPCPPLRMLAFDIEAEASEGIPNPEKDRILSISVYDGREAVVLTTAKSTLSFVESYGNEAALIRAFVEMVRERDPDVLVGYNSGNFDLPFLKERAKRLKVAFELSRYGKMRKVRKGLFSSYHIPGMVHIDLYPVSFLLNSLGMINPPYLTLKEVYKDVFGEEPLRVDVRHMKEEWLNNKEKVLEYSKGDAVITYRLAERFIPFLLELSMASRLTLFNTSLATAGQFVENKLMWHARREGLIIPRRPKESEVRDREKRVFEGAYVKLPQPGIYEKVAVVDFKSMYPSIILTYNVCPYTLTDEDGDVYISPVGHKFKKSPQGFIPKVLEGLYNERSRMKALLKELEGEEKERLSRKVYAYKVLINSFYGYLGYARSRWYCFECAESVAAWGREIIKMAEEYAEKKGFKVLYIDTDSLFLLYKGKSKEDVLAFLNEINELLPGKITLDLEGFYERALFVSKRSEGKGAKKKYALLDEKGNIKIRGFELVRRDWSEVAKEVQEKVLEVLLREGDRDKAVSIVREYIEKVRRHQLPLEKFVIYSRLNKNPDEYEVISPELSAALKLAKAKGIKPRAGMVVGFVIGKKGRSVSEKAVPAELATDYDEEYYIQHQILPAVMKLLGELGVSEAMLSQGHKQRSLMDYFS